MKKYLSVLLCLLLAVALLLTGCNGNKPEKDDDDGKTTTTTTVYVPTDEEAIVGKWVWNAKLSQFVNMDSLLGEEMGEMAEYFDFSDLVVDLVYEFNADGTAKAGVQDESFPDLVNDIVDITIDGTFKMLEDMVESMNMTMEEYYASAQTTKEELIAQMKQSMDTEELETQLKDKLKETALNGYYALKDGKIYISNEKATLMNGENGSVYTLNGNTLTVKESGMEIVLNKK